jgi:arylsulfatase A-like enzyme
VLIAIDTLRADHLGCYGYRRIGTPAIDQLASEGVRFEHAYAQVPLTLPSHTVILTGTYPMFNGVRDLTSPGLNQTIPTLAEIMRQNGYSTAAFVSSFVLNSMWGLNRGFEVYDYETDPGAGNNPSLLERRGDRTVGRVLDWLDSHADRPFFVWVHLYDPHSPYRPPEPYFSRYAGHLYDGEIAFDDEQLGRLFAQLRKLNLYDNSLIVLASDHGESLG